MNPVFIDPDIKINMSLDDIIKLTKRQLRAGCLRKKKKKMLTKKRSFVSDHPVNCTSDESHEKKRKLEALTNSISNTNFIEETKKIIPAEYKLIRTSKGIERVLVPALKYVSQTGDIKPLRKLKKPEVDISSSLLPDLPPPLVAAPIHKPTQTKIKVEVPDDDILVLDHIKKCELIDLVSDVPGDVLQARKLCVTSTSNNKPRIKTLNERFTLLSGKF